jgi:hypothetical protein
MLNIQSGTSSSSGRKKHIRNERLNTLFFLTSRFRLKLKFKNQF